MLSFECDYAEGAHEAVLQHLLETNLEQLPGYGQDRYCDAAKEKIRSACACPDADVFFISGGTQTNQIVIDAMLHPYEGVIAADTSTAMKPALWRPPVTRSSPSLTATASWTPGT